MARLLVFCGLVGLTALALQPVQRAMRDGIRRIRDEAIGRVEAAIGRQIRYASISPSMLGAFDIRGLRVLGKEPGSTDVFSVSRFRLSWSLWDLLRGRPHFIRSIVIDRPRIHLDLEWDRDLLELFASGGALSRPELADLFPSGVLVRIRGGQCAVRNRDAAFLIEGVQADVRAADSVISMDARWVSGVSLGTVLSRPLNARISMRLTGSCAADFIEGDATLAIAPIEEALFRTRPLSFGCTLRDGILGLRTLSGTIPLDFFLDYDLRERSLAARLKCEAFMPGDLLTLSGDWSGANQLLGLAVSGAASFERDEGGTFRYRADLSGGFPGGGEDAFAFRAGGDETLASVEELRVSMPAGGPLRGNIGFRGNVGLGPLSPAGVLLCENLTVSGDRPFSAEWDVSRQGNTIRFLGKSAAAGPLVLDVCDISLVPSGEKLGFGLSALWENPSAADGAVSLNGSFNYASRRLEANCALDAVSAADLATLARPFAADPLLASLAGGVPGDVSLSTELFFSTDFRRFSYRAPRVAVAFGPEASGGPVGIFSLSGTDRRFELSESRLVWADKTLTFSGYADYSKPMDIVFSLTSDFRELSWSLQGRLLDRRQLSVQGSHGFQAYITATDTGTWSGYVEGRDIPVPVRGVPARFSFFTSIRYHSPDFWSLDLDTFEGRDIASPAGPGYVRIAGNADQDGARFPLLYYRDKAGPLRGRADIAWAHDFSGFTGRLSMEEENSGRDGTAGFSPAERYLVEGSLAEKRLSLFVSGSRMRLGRALYNANNALADADLTLTWEAARSYEARLNLHSLNAKVRDREIAASARASLNTEEFTVRDLRLSAAGIEGLMPLLKINRAESAAETSADFRGSVGGKPLEGAFAINARFAPVSSWLWISGALRSFSGSARVERLRYAAQSAANPFDIVFSRQDGELSVSGGPRDMLRLRLDRDGTFYAALSSPFPVRGSLVGTVRDNTIDARCPDLYVDLAGLWKLLPPLPDLALTGGIVNAQVAIRGPLTDPEFFGSARGVSVRARVPQYITQDIRPVPFTVAIEGNEMRFGPVPATVGRGAGTVTGVFRFDRWIPNIFTMDIVVPRETPVPYAFDITGFLAKGDASGTLRLSMEDMVFDIAGDILANNTELGIDADEVNQAQGADPFAGIIVPVMVDLKVTSGPAVEFLWPSSGFPILRANPDMGTVVHVTADSTARQFSLTSDIKIRGGEIFYFERNFYIRSGTLTFRENETRFDPILSVRAEIRDRTNDGPVTIAMIVDKAPLLSFTARFESSPSLSQAEIVALLGQNITGERTELAAGSVQRALLSSTSDILAQFGVVRQLERRIRNLLGLDMFSIRTQVLQNAVFGATGLGQDPVDRNGWVGNYFDNTTVFLGKYIGQDMFIQSMLTVRYDENNTSTGGIRIEPDIGVELETPLFNIRWNFVPAHPENWYVNDNSITLTWSKSF
jgi:hypothetical protein